MTTDPFTDAAYAESRQQWPMRDQRSAFESGARWAQRYLAVQEPTDAECIAVLNAVTTPFGEKPKKTEWAPVAIQRCREAMVSARAARRDEETR